MAKWEEMLEKRPKDKGIKFYPLEALKKLARSLQRRANKEGAYGAKKKQSPAEIIKNTQDKWAQDRDEAEAQDNPVEDRKEAPTRPTDGMGFDGGTAMEQAMMAKPSSARAVASGETKKGPPAKKHVVDPEFLARHEARMKASAYKPMGKEPIEDVVRASTAETMASHYPSSPMAAVMPTPGPSDPMNELPQTGRSALAKSLGDTGSAAIDQVLSEIEHLVSVGLLSKDEAEIKRADALNSMKRKAKELIN